MIKFYNSLTRKKEEFIPIEKNKVKMYTCGPTVYNHAHIGNLRAYMLFDILSRTLKYFGYEVVNVMNLTDVDDKTIKGSKIQIQENKTPNEKLKQFTLKYTDLFFEDLKQLNVEFPKFFVNATDSITQMQLLINNLFEKKYAYLSDDGIYFDVSKDKNYGRLVDIDFNKQKYNKENRVINDEYEKDNLQDFALWKFKKYEDEPSWIIEIDNKKYEGRPGWHIECSAMIYKVLGKHIDIHTGGIDLKFPHHENEIAQSSCAFNTKYVNYWIHNGHLQVDSKKMSKSLNNFYTLQDILSKGYSAYALRELYLRAHYSSSLNFTFESLEAGVVNVEKINNFYNYFKNLKVNNNIFNNKIELIFNNQINIFEKALKDDLNTSMAISAVHEFMNQINRIENFSSKDIEKILLFMQKVDSILGLLDFSKIQIPIEIINLANKRKIARENKNWEKSDDLRNQIREKGFEIKDSKDTQKGYIITKI